MLAVSKMAVRRQLRRLFQEPQVGGAITVERPETGNCRQKAQDAKVLAKQGDQVPGVRGFRLENCVVFQCWKCRAVLGDSLHLCAQEEKLRLLVCFKVTNNVVVEDSLMFCVEGDLTGCTYNTLYCRSCEKGIGFRLYCSTSLTHLRGFFCLFKDSIICYLLKTKTTVEASKMAFPPVSLKDHVQKLKENLVLMHTRIELMMKKLEELNQQRIVAEKQGFKAKPHGLTSGYTMRKLRN